MLRSLLLYLSRAVWARNIVMKWGLARRVALRFVAGETEDAALDVIRDLNARGLTVTADILGESVADADQTRRTRDAYSALIAAIRDRGLSAWVSLKLTALGIDIDESLCYENMRHILEEAQRRDVRVTIDMEDHPYTDRTLTLFRGMRDSGYDNVRTVVQSYLYRSDDDVRDLADEGAGLRLVKGAYKEPSELAYPKKSDVDAAFVRQMTTLLDAAAEGRGYPAIATHDEAIIEAAKAHAAQHDIPPDRYEFQMLYGVREALQESLREAGYRVRVYVPFGSEWYPYFMRRLAERPANVWFFASNLFRR